MGERDKWDVSPRTHRYAENTRMSNKIKGRVRGRETKESRAQSRHTRVDEIPVPLHVRSVSCCFMLQHIFGQQLKYCVHRNQMRWTMQLGYPQDVPDSERNPDRNSDRELHS